VVEDAVAVAVQPASNAATADLEAAWDVCADLFCTLPRPLAPAPQDLEDELLFCLLGGYGVTFEHGRSACQRLAQLRPFTSRLNDQALEQQLRAELDKPQFEPRRRNGSLRRYRYPARKAELVVRARTWLRPRPRLLSELTSLLSEQDRRRVLCGCPGIGEKTASWLLRNLGLAHELAIVDIHLVRALREAGRIGSISLPRDYDLVEAAFIDWCRDIGAPPAAFDLFVWEWQRGSLFPER